MPFFVVLLALIVDASMLFNSQAQMLRVVQDANRAYSTGQFSDPEQVQEYLFTRLSPMSEHVSVPPPVLDTDIVPSGIIRTTASIPAADLNSIGLITALMNFDLSVTAQHYREY